MRNPINVGDIALGMAPLRTILPWAKNFEGTGTLPVNWVECNGQVLNLPTSIFHGKTMPDLNGATGTKSFLRGSATSGTIGGNTLPAHTHPIQANGVGGTAGPNYGFVGSDTKQTGSFGTGTDVLPYYYEVVFIMRVI